MSQEVLFIKKRANLKLISILNDKKYISSKKLNDGDIIFLFSGGHGFKMIEDTEMIEVK